VKLNQSSVVGHSGLDGERLLAISRLLRKGSREFEFFLCGTSMGPALPDGSWIRVRLAAADQFMAGQVLTYVAKDRVVAHRLVRSVKSGSKEYLITRGDATVCCDLPVVASSVIGIVTEYCTTGAWQPVGPQRARWFGFVWTASAISMTVGGLARLNPGIAAWTARRIIRIHRIAMRCGGFAKRYVARWSATRTGAP
jgi:hypothetical protein